MKPAVVLLKALDPLRRRRWSSKPGSPSAPWDTEAAVFYAGGVAAPAVGLSLSNFAG